MRLYEYKHDPAHNVGGRGYWPDAAADYHGSIGVVYEVSGSEDDAITPKRDIYFARWHTGSNQWDTTQVNVSASSPNVVESPALAFDIEDNAYVAWTYTIGGNDFNKNLLFSYEIDPNVFIPVQTISTNRSDGAQLASYNNTLNIAYHYDNAQATQFQVYSKWRQADSYCADQYYVDVACNYWAFQYIKWAGRTHNYMEGYTGTDCATVPIAYPCYLPHHVASRAEISKAIYRAEGWSPQVPGSGNTFTDVPRDHWAFTYIETAYARGVISGEDAATCTSHNATYPCFLPNETVTRAQMCAFLYRAHSIPAYTPTSGQTFTDVGRTSWAFLFVESTAHAGIISGYPDGSFHPNEDVSRDQAARTLYRTYNGSD